MDTLTNDPYVFPFSFLALIQITFLSLEIILLSSLFASYCGFRASCALLILWVGAGAMGIFIDYSFFYIVTFSLKEYVIRF